MELTRPCPCGSPAAYDVCCGRLHRGAEQARTAEELMRSRYAAHAVGGRVGADHLFRTWHPRTRPAETTPGQVTWTGLEIVEVIAGGEDDTDGIVEFRAYYGSGRTAGVLHERSAFTRRAGRWVYVDGTHQDAHQPGSP